MSKLRDQPAFPERITGELNDQGRWVPDCVSGLTKREWFAGMALQALITYGRVPIGKSEVAKCAIDYADALLSELDKP